MSASGWEMAAPSAEEETWNGGGETATGGDDGFGNFNAGNTSKHDGGDDNCRK